MRVPTVVNFAAAGQVAQDGGVTRRAAAAYGLAALLVTSGTAHFVVTDAFAKIVPSALGHAREWVLGSGVVELACAAGLVLPRTRRAAGIATAVLFVAVFPANVTMALDSVGRSNAYRAAVYARLPLQLPLLGWALWVGRAGQRRTR